MNAFDLPAELAKVDAEYVPVVIERHFGTLFTVREVRLELRPTCPDCRALWEQMGTEQPCPACDAADTEAFKRSQS